MIQYASVQAVADPGQRMRAEIQGLVQGTSTTFYLPLNDVGASGVAQVFQGTQPIQLVSDSTVSFILHRSTISGNSWLSTVSLSGYLEDLP